MNAARAFIRGCYARLRPERIQTRAGSHIGKTRCLANARFIGLGERCTLRSGAWLGVYSATEDLQRDPRFRVVVEDDVYIGFYSCITAINLVKIGSGTVISDYFYASDHTHGHDPRAGSPLHQPLESKGPVLIGRNCFIGYRVSIMPGVTLADSCVVGAHTVVTKSFPAMTMICGAPGKAIKRFDISAGKWLPISE